MFFLNKMFKLRDKANPDEEKPFLEHLEDLRIMVTRVVLTLLISTLACFIYKDELMSIILKACGLLAHGVLSPYAILEPAVGIRI